MSTQAINLVKSHTVGSPTAKVVLLILADYADADWSAFASQKRIAAEAEVSERTVRRTLTDLVEMGILRRERRHRTDGSRTSDRLVLVADEISRLPATLSGSGSGNLPATLSEPTGHSVRTYRPLCPNLPAKLWPRMNHQ